jgi:hypothetical protein
MLLDAPLEPKLAAFEKFMGTTAVAVSAAS